MSENPPGHLQELPFLVERRSWKLRRGFRRTAGVPLFVASLICSLAHAAEVVTPPPAKKVVSARKQGVNIKVVGDGWGNVSRERIESLLYAVADELLSDGTRRITAPIVVERTRGNPMALYDRGPQGEYRVLLHAQGEAWPLYAYEFAHELAHILSNFDENAQHVDIRANQWFEEALCETASLYVLRSLSNRWQTDPAMLEWRAHAPAMAGFAERLLKEDHRQMPSGRHISEWLTENEARLRQNPYIRQKNEALASILLPLFERNGDAWKSLRFLNLDPADTENELRAYLRNWYANCPTEHRHFIGDVMAALGVTPDEHQIALAPAHAMHGGGGQIR